MKKLIMLGAGNVGGFLSYNIDMFGSYDVLGFLDDDVTKIGKKYYDHFVLGKISELMSFQSDEVAAVICIASPRTRASVAERVISLGMECPNFIAGQAWLSKEVDLGFGNIVYPGVSINYESKLRNFTIVNMNCAIGHNCEIESFATLSPGISLAGFTRIGECAEIGIGAATRQGVQIGRNAVVGGQSMVINDIPDYARVVGVPSKMLPV